MRKILRIVHTVLFANRVKMLHVIYPVIYYTVGT